MFPRTGSGSESNDGRFTAELSQLKRRGANVLVVGSVRANHRRDVCRRLLGWTSDRPRRRVLVSTTSDDTAHPVGGDDWRTRTVTYTAHARSATASESSQNATAPVAPATGNSSTATTLTDIGIAISSAIEEFETDADGLAPAELRVGIDSLVPLLEEYETERVFKFVHLTSGRTRDADGMIHYHLPMERDSDVAAILEPLFDLVVELRDRNDRLQERWSIRDGDHTTGWISLE